MDPWLLLSDYTFRNVTLGAMTLGTVSGALGAFAVLRRQSLMGDAISHAALPGVVIAFMLLGTKALLPLLAGAAIAGWLGTRLIAGVTRHTAIKEDTALGIILSVFFGFGLLLLTVVQRQGNAQQAGLDSFLFGKAAALVTSDVQTMGGIGIVVLLLLALFWKEFKLLAFDPSFAATLGFPVRALDMLLTTLLVIAIVVGIQAVGVVLMSAMIVAPATAARQWTDRLDHMVLLSAAFGILAGLVGAWISAAEPGLSTGPVIVVAASLIVLVSLLAAPRRGVVWGAIRRRRQRAALRTTAVLSDLYTLAMRHGDPLHAHPLGTLRAARPASDVRGALARLAARGFVRDAGRDEWALTDAGLTELRRNGAGEEMSDGGR